jgi:RNase H-fold protein (predicted Holliday junction resolvase)
MNVAELDTADSVEQKVGCVLAVDPGKKKCGLAVVSVDDGILHRAVVPCDEFGDAFKIVYRKHAPGQVLLGSSTGSKEIAEAIQEETEISVKLVDERHTTELAKLRYFKEYPPKGLWKLVPIGLRTPPTCYDDFAAVVLAERYLKELE